MGVRLFCNRVLIWRLAGIHYEMLKLGSDDLVLGIRTLSVEPHCCITCCFKFGEMLIRIDNQILRSEGYPYKGEDLLTYNATVGLHGQSPDPQNEAIGTKFRHLVVNTSQTLYEHSITNNRTPISLVKRL
ncbi:hypothetical protein M9H77_34716 [Catharanthus roseus]|uniref:Uncharacterized protein n=1 Tax=Catharanthus roseus TaxID=4058 RepID=A0ACB9ZLZ2_CATRO|nr:hypothetical protein M9H77_34716 [Catharanthus roseus]